MKWLLALAAIALLAVAAFGIWSAVNSPEFWARAASLAVSAVATAALPVVLKRMPPDREKAWREKQLTGQGDRKR